MVVLIWQFTSIWNDFLFAVFFSDSPERAGHGRAQQPGQRSLLQNYGVQMAGALIASLPTLLVYILLGRYFVRGLMAGSVKG